MASRLSVHNVLPKKPLRKQIKIQPTLFSKFKKKIREAFCQPPESEAILSHWFSLASLTYQVMLECDECDHKIANCLEKATSLPVSRWAMSAKQSYSSLDSF